MVIIYVCVLCLLPGLLPCQFIQLHIFTNLENGSKYTVEICQWSENICKDAINCIRSGMQAYVVGFYDNLWLSFSPDNHGSI